MLSGVMEPVSQAAATNVMLDNSRADGANVHSHLLYSLVGPDGKDTTQPMGLLWPRAFRRELFKLDPMHSTSGRHRGPFSMLVCPDN
jgi:hypothetical protein